MYYVYRFVDKSNNIFYVGKSKQDLEQRFRGHAHLPKECYELVHKIEYIECLTESDMSIKEIYYINKYRNSYIFFNILDTTELPTSVEFEDKWEMYNGPLPETFLNSINYKEGYTYDKVVRYNKDGTIDKRKTNKEKGESSYVEGFTKEEVDLIIDYLISEINNAENSNQEQIRFRNLLMFVLGVNLPLKTNDFLGLKYKDLFDENDCPKAIRFDLGRFHQDETIYVPLRKVVIDVIVAYTQKYGLSYKTHSDEELFQSRKHQVVSVRAWWNILTTTTKAAGLEKNIGAESLRKTYGLNIYNLSLNKLNALLFLGEIWGQVREAKIIKYLGLSEEEVDFEYYLGENFALGNVNLEKIKCLKNNKAIIFNMYEREKSPLNNEAESSQTNAHAKEIELTKRRTLNIESKNQKAQKTNRSWTKERKLEIINEYLIQNIPQKLIAQKYNIDAGAVSRWVTAYKKHGIEGLQDKRQKNQ